MPISSNKSKGPFQQNKMTKAAARKTLTPDDKKAMPIFGRKYNNPNSSENGMWQEDRLVKHILDRLRLSDVERQDRVQRMSQIDIQLSGVVTHEEEDRKRDRSNKKGRKPKPVAHNLPLAYAQLDDCVTYCMSLFAPEMNMFIATSTAKKQSVAEGLTREIGKHGQTLQYYRHTAKFVYNSLKYNLGALSVVWEQQSGKTYVPDTANGNAGASGQITTKDGVVWEGNLIKSLDMYNFLYDTSVHPVDLPLRGEYFAEVNRITPFRAKRMAQQKILFGVDRFINTMAAPTTANGTTFYVQPPVVRETIAEAAASKSTNWQQLWASNGPARDSQAGIELIWYTTWCIPSDFGLSDSDELELWCLGLAQGQYLAAAFEIESTHGQLPCACSTPIEDDLNNDQRTYAEMLLPLQHFASFLLNTHVEATRKAIYGITVYDKNAFPGLDLDTVELIGARIPMKSSAGAVDIDKMFRHYNDAPQTDQNVEMVGKIVELMQKILPTNMANQVADLQRATEYQAAATVQASSRRNLKIARIINDQALQPVKFQMMYNIYEHMTVIEYFDNDGNAQQITPQQLLEAQIEFDIGTGLKGMDRLMQVSIFKDLMSYLFQVKDIGQQVNLLDLLSYVTQIAGFETDLSQFKIQQQPQPQIGPDGKPIQPPPGTTAAPPAGPASAAPAVPQPQQ